MRKFPTTPGSSYSQRAKKRRNLLEKGKFTPDPFVASQNEALQVRLTPYRPQVAVAVANDIAAAAVAAKVEITPSNSPPRLSNPG